MALVRCEKCGQPIGRTRNYVKSVEPIGYKDSTAIICGTAHCENPGLVWLDENDNQSYTRGERIFTIPNVGVKIKVQ